MLPLALTRHRRPTAAGPQPPAHSRRPTAAGPQPPARLLPPRPLQAACCLGLILALLPAAPACAAHWMYSISGTATTGGASPTTINISTGPVRNIASFSSQSTQQGNADGSTVTATASISATVTATWTPESFADNAPAPPSVSLDETSEASASGTLGGVTQLGTCSDGIGDTNPDANGVVRGHKYVTSGGGTSFSFQVALTATTSIKSFQPYTDGGGQFHDGTAVCKASVGPCNFTVHAQPYNFKEFYAGPNADGSISFDYTWASTDGTLGDIANTCTVYEYVTYPSVTGYDVNGVPVYQPSSPPWDADDAFPNPTVLPSPPAPGSKGEDPDTQGTPGFAPVSELTSDSFSSTQYYYFDDTVTGQTKVQMPGSVTLPITITRQINKIGANEPWFYQISKDGYTNLYTIPGQ